MFLLLHPFIRQLSGLSDRLEIPEPSSVRTAQSKMNLGAHALGKCRAGGNHSEGISTIFDV